MAERLVVDLNRYRSWETGRRPLGNIASANLGRIVRVLRLLGADPRMLDRIRTAIDVDSFVGDVLAEDAHPDDHHLATWVSTRDWNDLLGWALVGPPGGSPQLPRAERQRFYDNLRVTAEQATGDQPADVLLRRQVYYLAARDNSPAGRDWVASAERQEVRKFRRVDSWNPAWVAGRSLAVARACQGDPEALRDFIRHQLTDDLCEAANLNYYAYWVGESHAQAASDEFMAADLGQWRGTVLLGHLVDGLGAQAPYLDLLVHTVWSLLARRTYLLDDDHTVTARLAVRVRLLLDQPPAHLGPQARRELEQLDFLARTSAKGPRTR